MYFSIIWLYFKILLQFSVTRAISWGYNKWRTPKHTRVHKDFYRYNKYDMGKAGAGVPLYPPPPPHTHTPTYNHQGSATATDFTSYANETCILSPTRLIGNHKNFIFSFHYTLSQIASHLIMNHGLSKQSFLISRSTNTILPNANNILYMYINTAHPTLILKPHE